MFFMSFHMSSVDSLGWMCSVSQTHLKIQYVSAASDWMSIFDLAGRPVWTLERKRKKEMQPLVVSL